MIGMLVNGKHSNAMIFTKSCDIDQYALAQVLMVCDNPVSEGCKIRVMPDVHPGKIGPIGLTMTIKDRIIPGLVGIDIGCGVTTAKVGKIKNDFQKLDTVIRDNVPAGFNIREKPHDFTSDFKFASLNCAKAINTDKVILSLGTLGGGNHFIELDKDEDNNVWLTVHTGSRRLGKEVAEYYMNLGQKVLKKDGIDVPYEMTYLYGDLMKDYLHDVDIVQEYAEFNRLLIIDTICRGMKWKLRDEEISSMHNYVGFYEGYYVLRKGAISACKGETVIIPINMKDGVIIGKGLGNSEWNCSAPHGSGRIASREEVKQSHTVSEYKNTMKGIYSSCINSGTLDEAPFAYRNIDYIKETIQDTVTIEKVLKPIYNFKAGSK